MAFLNVTIPSSGQYQGYATRNANHCVVIPLSVSSNDSIIFDDNVSTSIPLFSGVIFEYDSSSTFQNFQITGTAGDSFLLWFDNNGDATGPHYIVTNGANFNANITNGTLNTNANITNSTLNTNANITNSSINANITNATLNTNATITNSSLNTTVTGTVNENINGQNISLYTTDTDFSGSFFFDTPTVNLSLSGAYVALQVTLAPNDHVTINSFTISAQDTLNVLASYYYSGSSYILPPEAEWNSLVWSGVVLPSGGSQETHTGGWVVRSNNNGTSTYYGAIWQGVPKNFSCNSATWIGRLVLTNTTSSNQTFYFGVKHSGNAGEYNEAVSYFLSLSYQGLTSGSSSIQGIYNNGSGGSGGGGTGGGGGHKYPY